MNKRQISCIGFLALLIVAGAAWDNLWAQAAGGARPTAIAVVDIEEVLNNLEERKSIRADLSSKLENLQKWEQSKRKELQNLQNDLKILDPSDEAYKKMRESLDKKSIELGVELKYRQRQLEMEQALQLESIYRKMVGMIERVAKQDGYELVLFKDKLPQVQGANAQQLIGMMNMRKVLYAADRLDLTDPVTQRLNNEFNNPSGGNG